MLKETLLTAVTERLGSDRSANTFVKPSMTISIERKTSLSYTELQPCLHALAEIRPRINRIVPAATKMMASSTKLNAAAAPRRPEATCDKICTVMSCQSADTRKIAALTAVIARTKEKTSPEKKAGAMKGA